MYVRLIGVMRRWLIEEVKDVFSKHPLYRKVVPYVQNKFSFEERPQYGVVVKSPSANKVALAADNFLGEISSHVMLAYLQKQSFPLEWVREDAKWVAINGMTTVPGVYYIEVLSVPTTQDDVGTFVVDPLITVTDKPLMFYTGGPVNRIKVDPVPFRGTFRLYLNGKLPLREGTHYNIDYTTGVLTLLQQFGTGSKLSADYRYPGASVGPITFSWNTADSTTLPGVILAFGRRAEVGGKAAVVVTKDRTQTAEAYGGKFETNFDLDILSQDHTQMEEMADFLVASLLDRREAWEFEGIELVDISLGGESEELTDNVGNKFTYVSSVSVQLRGDWEIHRPIPLVITSVGPKYADGPTPVDNRLFFASFPAFNKLDNDYERMT